MFQKACCKK